MQLTVIILNWNAAEDTIRCVRNILSWQQLRPIIIVVDNASGNDNVELIARECPQAHLICNAENLGFAGGTNRGVEQALKTSNAPILLLNNDAAISEADAAQLLETLTARLDIGLISPLLYDAAQTERLIAAGSKNPIKHHQTRIDTPPPGNSVYPVEYVSGTAVMIRAEVFRSVGLLNEDYFFSTELADLCLRARQQGYSCAVDTRTKAYHRVSRSANLRDTLFVYYIVRNRFIFIRNWPYKTRRLYFIFWTAYSAALWLKLKLAGQRPTAHAVWLGLADGLRGRFGGQNERVLSATGQTAQPTSSTS